MQHIIKFKLYYFLALIIFLASFRGTEASLEALTYSVPTYISIVQKTSPFFIIILMIISLLIKFGDKFHYQKYYKDAVSFLVFFIILNLSGSNIDIEQMIIKILFSIITFMYFVKIVSRLHLNYIFIFFSLGSFLFTIVNLLSYFLFPGTIWNGRLFGVTNHPNFVGVAATVTGIFGCFYLFNSSRWKYKFFNLVILIISLFVCFLSGSRNSVLSLIIGLLILVNFKFKTLDIKILLILIASLFLLYVINSNFSTSNLDYEGRGNTRAESWKILLDAALEFPIFGKGKEGITSNSYLFAIVASGLVGFFFLSKSILGFLIRLNYKESSLNFYYPLIVMLSASLLFAAIFEGFLLDQMSIPVFTFWLVLVIPLNKQNRMFKRKNARPNQILV